MQKLILSSELLQQMRGIELTSMSRRNFLILSGLFGALAPTGVLAKGSKALPDLESVDWAEVLRGFSVDTLNGLAAFAVPGLDPFSKRQKLTVQGFGGVDNGAGPFMSVALDISAPFDPNLSLLLITALAAMRDRIIARIFKYHGRAGVIGKFQYQHQKEMLDRVDQAFFNWLSSSAPKQGLPLTLFSATLLNLISAVINPRSVKQGFFQGFASLSWRQKARVFMLLEAKPEKLVKLIWGDTQSPVGRLIVGNLRFLPGALLQLACSASYVEPPLLIDFTDLSLIARPPGWDFAGYQIDDTGPRLKPVDGWDDFMGYFEGRTEVKDA